MALLYAAIVFLFIPTSLDANRVESCVDDSMLALELGLEEGMCSTSIGSERSGDHEGNASALNHSQSDAAPLQVEQEGHQPTASSMVAVQAFQAQPSSAIVANMDRHEEATGSRPKINYHQASMGPNLGSTGVSTGSAASSTPKDSNEFRTHMALNATEGGRLAATMPKPSEVLKDLPASEKVRARLEQGLRRLPAGDGIPTLITARVKQSVQYYWEARGFINKIISIFDFDDTLWASSVWRGHVKNGESQGQVVELLRGGVITNLLTLQPGIIVIVTNGRLKGWINDFMPLVPELNSLVEEGRLLVISSRSFEGRETWEPLVNNKFNVFPLVLGAFAMEGITFELVYSYGDGPVDMKAGQYLINRFRLNEERKQKWIGIRFLEMPLAAELRFELTELTKIIQDKDKGMPTQHLEFVESDEGDHAITLQPRKEEEICAGWDEWVDGAIPKSSFL